MNNIRKLTGYSAGRKKRFAQIIVFKILPTVTILILVCMQPPSPCPSLGYQHGSHKILQEVEYNM